MPPEDASSRAGRDVWLLLAAAVALASMFGYRIGPSVVDVDIWHQMALMREAARVGHVPVEDVFAYTPTKVPQFHHEWGSGAIALFLANACGAAGIVALRYGLTVLLAALTVIAARLHGATILGVAALAPIAILLLDHGFATVRAQMYSFAAFAALLGFLALDRRGRRWWIAPWLLLYVAWINVHGGFVAGAGVLGLHGLEQLARGRPWRHLVAVGLAMLALFAVTPFGVANYGFLLQSLAMQRPEIAEWWALHRAVEPAYLFLFALSLVLTGYAWAARGVRACPGWPIVVATSVAALISARLVFFHAIAWLVLVPGWLRGTTLARSLAPMPLRRRRFLLAFCAAITLLFTAMLLPLRPWLLRVPGGPVPRWGDHVFYPVGAVDYLESRGFRGNLMVPFDWGAYVLWRLHPDVKVSLDSRYEATYSEQVFDEHFSFYSGGEAFPSLLEKYPTDVVLVPRFLPLAERMGEAEGWKQVYADPQFALHARPGAELPVVEGLQPIRSGRFP